MISYIKGKVISINQNTITLETSGIGYEITMTESDASKLRLGEVVEIHIVTSFSMYDGIRLYGFVNEDDKKLFNLIKDTLPNTGNAKTMDYLNKIQKSVSEFKRSVIRGDERTLKNVFGFTSKTSRKIIDFLQDKIKNEDHYDITSQSYFHHYETALNALVNLGYRTSEVKDAISEILYQNREKGITLEDLIKLCIKKLSGK